MKKNKSFLSGFMVLTIITVIGCVGSILYFGASYQSKSKNFAKKYNENIEQLATLKNQYESEQQTQVDTEETASDKLNLAVSAGNAVAEGQNNYYAICRNESYQNNEDALFEAIKQNSAVLDPYFDTEDTSGNAIWYQNENTDSTWTFRTTYGFSESVLPVIWTCYNSSGELLAFTTANYSVEVNVFGDVEIYTTARGRAYEGNDSEDPEEMQEQEEIIEDTPKPKKKKKKKKHTTANEETTADKNSTTSSSSSSGNGSSNSTYNNSTSSSGNSSSHSSSAQSSSSSNNRKSDTSSNTKKSEGDWNTDEQYTQWER